MKKLYVLLICMLLFVGCTKDVDKKQEKITKDVTVHRSQEAGEVTSNESIESSGDNNVNNESKDDIEVEDNNHKADNEDSIEKVNDTNYQRPDGIGQPCIFLYEDRIIANTPYANNKNEYFDYQKAAIYSYNLNDSYYISQPFYSSYSLDEVKSNQDALYVDPYNQTKKIKTTIEVSEQIKEPFQVFDYSNTLITYIQLSTNHLVMLQDGHPTIITDYPVKNVRVVGDAIYYYDSDNWLYCYRHEETLKINEKVPMNYQVLGDYIYYVDENKELYRLNVISKEEELIDSNIALMASDTESVYYVRGYKVNENYSLYDELYMINNKDKNGNFMRIINISAPKVLFTANNKVYIGAMNNAWEIYYSIQPEKERFGHKVLYENDECIIYYVGYACYEEGYANIIIYDKLNHRIHNRLTDWMSPDSQLVDQWLYVRSESDSANIYRVNIETLEMQIIYEGSAWALGDATDYVLLDTNNIIISERNSEINQNIIKVTFDVIQLNIETQERQVLPIQGQVIHRDGDAIYYEDKGLAVYNLTTQSTTKISDHTDLEQISSNQNYLYLVEEYKQNGALIRINKEDNSVTVLAQDVNYTSWVLHNEDIYYANIDDEIVQVNLIDQSSKTIAKECQHILEKEISDESMLLYYLTDDDKIEVIEIGEK